MTLPSRGGRRFSRETPTAIRNFLAENLLRTTGREEQWPASGPSHEKCSTAAVYPNPKRERGIAQRGGSLAFSPASPSLTLRVRM